MRRTTASAESMQGEGSAAYAAMHMAIQPCSSIGSNSFVIQAVIQTRKYGEGFGKCTLYFYEGKVS